MYNDLHSGTSFQCFSSTEEIGENPGPTLLAKIEAPSGNQHSADQVNFRGSQVLNSPKGPSDVMGHKEVCHLRPQGPFGFLGQFSGFYH